MNDITLSDVIKFAQNRKQALLTEIKNMEVTVTTYGNTMYIASLRGQLAAMNHILHAIGIATDDANSANPVVNVNSSKPGSTQ